MSNEDFRRNIAAKAERLRKLAKDAKKIARSAASAGLRVLSTAAKTAVPGTIKKEVGWYIRQDGTRAWGRAGLMQYPERGEQGPHGLFLDLGTKYIAARHYIANALKQAAPAARRAMKRTAASRINRIVRP